MPLTKAQLMLIEDRVKKLKPEEIKGFLEKACESNFEPGLSLKVFEDLVDRMPADALQLLRSKLTKRGSAAGLTRLQKIIDKDPRRS